MYLKIKHWGNEAKEIQNLQASKTLPEDVLIEVEGFGTLY